MSLTLVSMVTECTKDCIALDAFKILESTFATHIRPVPQEGHGEACRDSVDVRIREEAEDINADSMSHIVC